MIMGDFTFEGLYEYMVSPFRELVGEFDTNVFDSFDQIHQLFINAKVGVSKFRILGEIKIWFKKMIIGKEMAAQWQDLQQPDRWDLPFIENAMLNLRVRLLFQDYGDTKHIIQNHTAHFVLM